jgi:hypothetical protein
MNKIYRWKTAPEETAESDDIEIQEIQETDDMENAVDEDLAEVGEEVQQINALISRIAELSHYRAIDDVDFIIEAIGGKDYPGSPALDVLPSNDDIDSERREQVKEYIYCLNSWAEGKSVEDAVSEFKASEKLLRSIYIHLGELDEEKKLLVQTLAGNLNGKVSSPEDVILEISDEDFIIYVYGNILGRKPDEDDLSLKLMELRRGKTRQELIKDVLESKESARRMLTEIAQSIQSSGGS